MNTAVVQIILKANDQTTKVLKNIGGALGSFGKAATQAGRSLALGLTLPIVGVGVVAAKLAIDFDSAMMGVNSVLKLSGDAFQTLKSDVLEFSTQTSKSSADVANSLRGIVSSGFEAADAMGILKVAVDAAGNMMVDAGTTTLALTSTLRAFGMEATEVTHVADVLQTAANNSAIVFDQLTGSIGTALGSAAAAGVSFEETAAALMTITDAGYSTAIATTNLNAIISGFLKPGADLVDLIAEWGYESGEAALQAIGLQGVMSLLTEATGGSASELATLLPNVRAFKGAVALARDGGDAFADSLDEIAAASLGAGEHAAMAAIRHESWAYQITKLKSEVEVFAIRLANTFMPAVIDIVNVLKDWATKLATLPAPMLELIAKAAILAAVLGPVLLILGKLIAIGISVASGLSAMASGISVVVTAVGILTGAATMLGAALMTIVPLAAIAGLVLLAVKIRDNLQAHKDLAAEAIITATSYEGYRQAVEDSDRWTVTLSEGVWKLVDANIALQNATGAAAAALAAEGIEQQKLLDAIAKMNELEAGIPGQIAQQVVERGKLATQLTLQDEALRNVAVAQGILTQAQVDAVRALESSDRAMLSWSKATQEAREASGFYTRALEEVVITSRDLIQETGAVGGVMAEIAMKTEQAAGGMVTYAAVADQTAESVAAAQEKEREAFELTAETVAEVFQQRDDLAQQFQADFLGGQEAFQRQMEQAARQHTMGMMESEHSYQRSRQELIARANAEINAMAAAGQDEQAADRQAKLDKDLAMLDHNYETKKSWAKWNWDIQQKMQEFAHAQQLADQSRFFIKELELWHAQGQAKISALQAEVADAGEMYMSLAIMAANSAKGVVAATQVQVGALNNLGKSYEALRKGAMADLAKAEEDMARLLAEIDAMVVAGPALPDMPDFSQWVSDYSAGVSKAGSQVTKSATSTMKQVVVDIAEAFKRAMEIFTEVSEYATPTGLAAGMEALRKDIQEAVRQLYLAYDSIGNEGVEGAKKIAEASGAVSDSIGKAVDTFGKLADYTPPLRSAIDSVLGDVKYVLVKVRTELLDLWGWAGERKDTVWGHMESWAEAVGGLVGLVGQAAETFTKLKDYTGIMPGAVDALVTDIKLVAGKLVEIGAGKVDEAQLAWAAFSGKLLNLVVGMIEDMEKIASYKGGIGYLSISGDKIVALVSEMGRVAGLIGYALYWDRDRYSEAAEATRAMELAWLELNAGLVSGLATAIEDLQALADYEGGIGRLTVSGDRIIELVTELGRVAGLIGYALYWDRDRYGETAEAAREMELAWLELNASLISTLAGTLEDMATLAAFKGGLEVAQDAIEAVMFTLNETAETIRDTITIPADALDESGELVKDLKLQWLELQAGLVSTLTGVVADIETLAGLEGGLTVSQTIVDDLMVVLGETAETIRNAIVIPTDAFDEGGELVDDLKVQWLELQAGLVSALSDIVEDLGIIARFKGGIVASQVHIENLITTLVSVVGWILEAVGDVADQFDEGEKYVDRLKIKWVEIQEKLITAIADITEGIEDIASFKAVDESKFKIALDATFDALYWFLYEFNERSELFAGVVSEVGKDIAKLMGDTVKSLGDTLDPLLDVATFSISPAEADVAIGLFFDALKLFLDEFERRAVAFGAQADTQTATLATAIGTTVSGIGNAVEALLDILQYKPTETVTIGENEYEVLITDIEARFERFFAHLASLLSWIESESALGKWTISTAAQELAEGIDTVMGHLKSAVDFLDEMATYGADTVAGVKAGFLSFLLDLMLVIEDINEADEAIGTEALSAAEQFASGCSTLLGHITDGINTLNSLPQLEIDFYLTGEGLGINFIQGMIDGLVNNASALYQTIASIVATAIAAAETAAGVASRSKKMWDLGTNMTAALSGALRAGQADVQKAMSDLMVGGRPGLLSPSPVYAPAGMSPARGAGAAGGGGDTYNYTLRATYLDSEKPTVARQFQLLEEYGRLRG